jgi:hypothetical protein
MIPYENNQLITPTEWAKRFPNSPYPNIGIRPEDASTILLDQYQMQTADNLERSNTAANTLASQYDAWLRSTQARSLGQLTTGIASATGINDLNNRALGQSAGNQLGLSIEQTVRNRLDQMGLGNSNNLINQQLGLAGEQRSADIGRIKDQWSLRNGQLVSDNDYIRGVWGRTTEQYGADQSNMARLAQQTQQGYGYAASDLENSTNRANLQESTSRRSATSQAAGAGAFGSAGFRDNIEDIGGLANLNRESAWNTYEQRRDQVTGQLGDIDYGRGNLDRRLQGDVAGYQKQLDDHNRNYQGDVINYRYGIGQADRDYRGTANQLEKALKDNSLAAQGLESMARSYGIQRKDIIQTLSTATQRNNINLAQMIGEMNAAYQQGDSDRIFQFNQFLANMMGMQ